MTDLWSAYGVGTMTSEANWAKSICTMCAIKSANMIDRRGSVGVCLQPFGSADPKKMAYDPPEVAGRDLISR